MPDAGFLGSSPLLETSGWQNAALQTRPAVPEWEMPWGALVYGWRPISSQTAPEARVCYAHANTLRVRLTWTRVPRCQRGGEWNRRSRIKMSTQLSKGKQLVHYLACTSRVHSPPQCIVQTECCQKSKAWCRTTPALRTDSCLCSCQHECLTDCMSIFF